MLRPGREMRRNASLNFPCRIHTDSWYARHTRCAAPCVRQRASPGAQVGSLNGAVATDSQPCERPRPVDNVLTRCPHSVDVEPKALSTRSGGHQAYGHTGERLDRAHRTRLAERSAAPAPESTIPPRGRRTPSRTDTAHHTGSASLPLLTAADHPTGIPGAAAAPPSDPRPACADRGRAIGLQPHIQRQSRQTPFRWRGNPPDRPHAQPSRRLTNLWADREVAPQG